MRGLKYRFFFILILLIVSGVTFAQYKQYETGLEHYQKQEFDKALTQFAEYFKKSGRDKKIDVEVHYYAALSHYRKKDYSNAIPSFREAVALNHANSGNIYWFMAKCHEKLGQHEPAIASYTQAIRILRSDNAAHAKLLFERGQIHLAANNRAAAHDDFSLAASINPDDESIQQELVKLAKPVTDKKTDPETNLAKDVPKETTKDKETKAPLKETKEPVKTPVVVSQTKTDKGNQTKAPVKEVKQTDVNTTPPPAERRSSALRNLPDGSNTDTKQENKVAERATPVSEPPPVAKSHLELLAETYKDEKRFALVIGNGNYPKEVGALRNPVNDATDLAKELRGANFDVQLLTNVTYVQMREAVRRFSQKLASSPRDQTVGLFYFAGHGVQFENENYLVPIDATVEFGDDIPRMCFPVQRMVLANMELTNSRMNIVILDACRNNPFPSATRSIGQGLTEMRRARGSFIAYATAPGSVAYDGTGRNGLYTQELLNAVRKPGLTIEQVFKEVRANVLRLSDNKQNTWDSSNIVGEFYFKFR